jgi:hypothetical protein
MNMLATSQYQPGYDVAPGESANHIAVLNYININTILNCYDLLWRHTEFVFRIPVFIFPLNYDHEAYIYIDIHSFNIDLIYF